jgi:DNA uptake protein ComE-like DNA-binding protein
MFRETSKLRALGITALMALALMACGGATTSGSATQSAVPSSTQPAAAATVAPAAAQPTGAAGPTACGAGTTAPTSATSAPAATAPQAAAPAATKLNLNEVTEDQLMTMIPGFSSRMVREFFEYRPYVSIQQFRKEIGKYVDEQQVATYEQYVYVPVDVDQADAATLQQLPGVDAAIADALIAGRPYGSNQAFLDKLAGSISAADAQQAAAYLAG